MRDKCHSSQCEYKFHSLSHVPRVVFDACVHATGWRVDNNESISVTAVLTISLSSHSTVVLR